MLFRASLGAIGTAAVLLTSTALVQAADVSFLTHWAPDTVAKLEAAAATYTAAHPDTKITVRAVPFGDLLTTIRSGGAPTIASIYDLWLPELVRDGLVSPAPDAVAKDVQTNWSEGIAAAAAVKGQIYGIPNEINVYALNYNIQEKPDQSPDGIINAEDAARMFPRGMVMPMDTTSRPSRATIPC